jgi:tetratricopeptide (TPR) repeat protein
MRSLASAVALLMLLAPRVSAAPSGGRALVIPFENVSHEGRIMWLGEASAVLLTDELNALGGNAITREERRAAFRQLQIPYTATLTDATVIRVGQLVGAARVIVGTLRFDGERLLVRARAIELEAGRIQGDITESGPVPDLFDTFERIAHALLPGANLDTLKPHHPPVAAFENYVKGLLAATPATAVQYLNAALRADPTFDRARLALWEVYDEQGEHARALAAVASIGPRSALARRAIFLSGVSLMNLKRNDEAFKTLKALADAQATPALLNNLGVIQLRRGGTPQTGLPTYYFNQAVDADPTESDYCFNLGYAYLAQRDLSAAIYWLREAVRRDPTDGDAHYVLGAALTGNGNQTEAAREKELARRLSSKYADWDKRPATDPVPKGLERTRDDVELPRAMRVEETIATGSQRDQQEVARFHLDRGRRLYNQEHDREALAELNRALFLSPYQAEAHLLVGRIHLRGGRVREAIDAFKIALWSAESAEGHAALAEAYLEAKDTEAARAEVDRALRLDPATPAARRVLDKLQRR